MTEPSTANAPLLFLYICRAWRDVALATPQLWASFQIMPYGCLGTELGRQQFRNWFKRAGSFPLSVALELPRPWDWEQLSRAIQYQPGWEQPSEHLEPESESSEKLRALIQKHRDIDEIFHQIIERSSQWRNVELLSGYEGLVGHEFQSRLQGQLPKLEITNNLVAGNVTSAFNAASMKPSQLRRFRMHRNCEKSP
ncbi:hypothetical protein DFH09DRAFT_997072 [Mycena vulgaris]|nr:hypothetical protein DFH09DRAFT_997072 [Mycena vulgaris]